MLLVLGSAAVGGALALRSSPPSAVLVLAHPVAAGQVIGRDDLAIAHVSGSGVHGIAASSVSEVVGETAQSNLPAGTMLTGPMLSTIAVPGAGQQVVAVALKEGAFPPELVAGRAVSVMQVPAAGSSSTTSAAVLVPSARVLTLTPDASTGVTVISLLVDNAHALAVSQASALGAVSLSVLPVAP